MKMGNRIDLDARALGQRRYLNRCAGRWREREMRGVDLIDGREIRQVSQVNRRLDDRFEARAGGVQNRGEVLHHALGLLPNSVADELARLRVNPDLSAQEQPVTRADGL